MERTPKNIYLPFIPTNKTAVTIYPFIFWSKRKKGWYKKDILIHEMFHWNEQSSWIIQKRFGLFQWLFKYILCWFWFNVIKGFSAQEHPMEKQAYKAQREYAEHNKA